jgi:hypothetical protein
MYIGDTIRLKAEFKNFDGEYFSPDNVVLKIYNISREIIEEINVTPYEKGKYQYDYTIPGEEEGPLYFEFCGTVGEKPVLRRSKIERKWA